MSKVVYSDQLLCAVCYTHYILLRYKQFLIGTRHEVRLYFFTDDGGSGGQVAKNANHRMCSCRQLGLFQRNDGRLYQVLRLGNASSNHQVIYVTEKGSNRERLLVTYGTGPLACLSLFPVAELDKVS